METPDLKERRTFFDSFLRCLEALQPVSTFICNAFIAAFLALLGAICTATIGSVLLVAFGLGPDALIIALIGTFVVNIIIGAYLVKSDARFSKIKSPRLIFYSFTAPIYLLSLYMIPVIVKELYFS